MKRAVAITAITALSAFAALALSACGNDKDKEDPKPILTAPPPASVTATPLVDTPPPAAKLGLEARVKTEVDGRGPDAGMGTAMPMPEGKATMSAATGWVVAKAGTWSTATSPDQKARLASVSLGATDSAAAKAAEGAAALGLTECTWGTPETVSLGKDKLPGTAADGVCKRAGADARAAYVSTTGAANALSVGTWDVAGGDANGVFSAFRSLAKAGGGGDAGIAACCQALQQNMNSAPPEQKFAYAAAIATCNGLKSSPEGRQALAAVRAALAGANVPSSCR